MSASPKSTAGPDEVNNAEPTQLDTTANAEPNYVTNTSKQDAASPRSPGSSSSSDYKENLDSTQETNKPPAQPAAGASAAPVKTTVTEPSEMNGSRHHTRSKRISGRPSAESLASTAANSSYRPAKLNRSIDECARLLASVDDLSYRQAILEDADRMMKSYLFPMCFPWNHNVASFIKHMPRDIDEMPAIVNMQDELYTPFEQGTFGYGGFEVGKDRKAASGINDIDPHCKGIRAASRRSDDPGTIELTVISPLDSALPYGSMLSPSRNRQPDTTVTEMPARKQTSGVDLSESASDGLASIPTTTGKRNRGDDPAAVSLSDDGAPSALDGVDRDGIKDTGENSYLQFRDEQASKKRKTELAKETAHKLLVSVRFGSVSSRSTFFHQSNNDRPAGRPILCCATLPHDFRQAKPARARDAPRISAQLGSYNCGNSEAVGRSRLLWTEVGRARSDRSRTIYSSVLTGNQMDQSICKRPREVTVGIRVNGSLVSEPVDEIFPAQPSAASVNPTNSQALLVGSTFCAPPSDAVIVAAVDAACGSPAPDTYDKGNSTCILDSDKLLMEVAQGLRASGADKSVISIGKLNVSMNPPQLDCLPVIDGLVRVVCTTPGKLQRMWVHDILNVAAQSNRSRCSRCTVCWRDDGTTVDTCIGCGVSVHLTCCWNRGERVFLGPDRSCWKCSVCSRGLSIQAKTVAESPKITNVPDSPGKVRRRATKLPMRFQSDFEVFPDKSPTRRKIADSSPPTTTAAPQEDQPAEVQGPTCQLCPHSGGAMSPCTNGDDSVGWVHEVCRTWAGAFQQQGTTATLKSSVTCAICGECASTDGRKRVGLIKCAANGCHVYFHPMCALVATKLAEQEYVKQKEQHDNDNDNDNDESQNNELQRYKKEDAHLCRLYTLDMLECQRLEGATTASKSASVETAVLPVAFCGIHNPEREATFYGCDPACQRVGSAMRVPPLYK